MHHQDNLGLKWAYARNLSNKTTHIWCQTVKLALQCWRWEFAPPENMAAEEVDMWSWDTPYLKDILLNKISEGEQEYLDYLSPGNPE